jgi:hypothetical protein
VNARKNAAAGLPDGKSKIPNWVNFVEPWNGKCCCMLWPFRKFYSKFGTFYGPLVYFVVIWYIFPVLVCCTKKNLATLCGSREAPLNSQLISFSVTHFKSLVAGHQTSRFHT